MANSDYVGGGMEYYPPPGLPKQIKALFDNEPPRYVSSHERKMISVLIAEARDLKAAIGSRDPETVIVRGDALKGLLDAVSGLDGWIVLDGELTAISTEAG